MKKTAIALIALFVAITSSSQIICSQTKIQGLDYGGVNNPSGKEWESPELHGYNKEMPHAWFFNFESIAKAKKVLPYESHWYQSLNGKWAFNWARTPQERPIDFYSTDFSDKDWDKIEVPSNWNIAGLGKDGSKKYGTPIYVNQPVIFYHKVAVDDWKGGVMRTPPQNWTTYKDRNEVGSYRKTFTLEKDWQKRETFLNFDGVDSFFYLWINGKYVGFSKNSRNLASFNISKYLKKGENLIAVEVYRNSDGSFLEAQDMFRLPGIFRSVYLTSKPKTNIRDLQLKTTISNLFVAKNDKKICSKVGTLKIEADLRSFEKKGPKGSYIEYSLFENKLYSATTKDKPIAFAKSKAIDFAKSAHNAKSYTEIKLSSPKLWSAEEPNCYTLVAQLKDRKGKVLETISSLTGFRQVEIRNTKAEDDEFGLAGRYFYVNGKPVKLKGVNRHECNPTTGHALSHKDMMDDIILMKKANINHVRNSHYPDDPYWYYLCDLYGIYLEDEANIESHEYYYGDASLSHPKEWENAHVARVLEMVYANHNHPSIVIWSLGNEAGPGKNFVTAYKELKKVDKSRPVQYERNNRIVDMGSNQYPSIAGVRAAVTGKENIKYPFHISEYAHSMGNACGNLIDYWDAIESTNFLCGGAIWDWIDQSLYNYTSDGEKYFAYGGDFGDYPNDGQFVMNGIIFADRTPKPQYFEVKKVYQNISITSNDPLSGKFTIFNKNYFTDLNSYNLEVILLKDGVENIVPENAIIGSLKDIKPRTKREFTIDYSKINSAFSSQPTFDSNSEYYINFKLNTKSDLPWAYKGYTQFDEQILVKKAESRPSITEEVAKVCGSRAKVNAVLEKERQIVINGDDFSAEFSTETGNLNSLSYEGECIFANGDGPRLDAFRAFTNNDNWFYQKWFKEGLHNLNFKVLESSSPVQNEDGSISLTFLVQAQAPNAAKIHGGTASGINRIEELEGRSFGDLDFRFVINQKWTIYADGSIELDASINSNKPRTILPRLGYIMAMPDKYDQFTYYGRGPVANYADRKTGENIGIYHSSVDKEFVQFPKPQEMNNHENCSWVTVTDVKGNGALFIANDSFSSSLNRNTDLEMTLAGHYKDLPKTGKVYLHLDKGVTGLGGNSCGQGGPLKHDRVLANETNFGFIIRPINTQKVSSIHKGDYNYIKAKPSQAYPKMHIFPKPPQVKTSIALASSVENGEGDAEHLIDGDPYTYWHTMYSVTLAQYPHWVDFDAGNVESIKGFIYLPRQDSSNGHIKDYEIYISQDGKNWGDAIHKGSFPKGDQEQRVVFAKPVKARFLRFKALNEQRGRDYATAAEITILKASK